MASSMAFSMVVLSRIKSAIRLGFGVFMEHCPPELFSKEQRHAPFLFYHFPRRSVWASLAWCYRRTSRNLPVVDKAGKSSEFLAGTVGEWSLLERHAHHVVHGLARDPLPCQPKATKRNTDDIRIQIVS